MDKRLLVIVDDGALVRDYLLTPEDAEMVFETLHGEGQEVNIIHISDVVKTDADSVIEEWKNYDGI